MPILPPPKNAANPLAAPSKPVASPFAATAKPVVSPFTATTSPATTVQAKTAAAIKVPNANAPTNAGAQSNTGLTADQVKANLAAYNAKNPTTQAQNAAMNSTVSGTQTQNPPQNTQNQQNTQNSQNTQNTQNNPNSDLSALKSASAPIDLTQFQPDIAAISSLNTKVADTEAAKRSQALKLEGQAINAPTTGDFYQNNLGYSNRLAEGQLANLGVQQNAANQTLQTKLALAQAQRTGGIEQANVPFKFNTITTPNSQVLNTATGQTVGGSTGDAVVKGANVQSLGDLTNNYNQMQANLGNIDSLQQGLTQFLGTSDLNPTSVPQINQAIGSILKGGVGSPKYQQLQNYVNDIASKYSIYFGNGGAQTNQVRDVANSLINGNASPQAITEVMAGLSTQAKQAMQGTYNQIQKLKANPSAVSAPDSSNPSGTGGSGGTGSGGGLYDF